MQNDAKNLCNYSKCIPTYSHELFSSTHPNIHICRNVYVLNITIIRKINPNYVQI